MRFATRCLLLPAFAIIALWPASSAEAKLETKKFRALLSANETKGDGGSVWTVTWNLDAQWHKPGKKRALAITVDSDFSKTRDSKLDRLRLGFRWLDSDYGKVLRKWYPVFLVQTEGDHGGDSIHTLLAAGYRQKRRYAFVELTAGFSKDIRNDDEEWVGDIGTQFGYERQFGRWKLSTGPKGEFGAVGDVRARGGRLRWSWDVALDYRATKKLGLGYRLWHGNTVPNARRTQWIGVTYTLK